MCPLRARGGCYQPGACGGRPATGSGWGAVSAALWQCSMRPREDGSMMCPAVKALTIRQPWAWAVVYAGKDVENRRWQTSYRGPLLIHAAKEDDPAGIARVLWTMADPEAFEQPRAAFETRGAIIGVAYLADILTDSPSRWAQPHVSTGCVRPPLPWIHPCRAPGCRACGRPRMLPRTLSLICCDRFRAARGPRDPYQPAFRLLRVRHGLGAVRSPARHRRMNGDRPPAGRRVIP